MNLSDIIEELQVLPPEVRNCLTKIRDLDISVEDSMGNLKQNVDTLFSKADNMDPNDLKVNFETIMLEGEKSIKQTEEKVKIANDVHGLLNKYLKHLDKEILTCKMDLEENNSGITDIIEKRSLDSEESSIAYQKENEYQLNRCRFEEEKEVRKKITSSKKKSNLRVETSVSSEDLVSLSKLEKSSSIHQTVSSSLLCTSGHMDDGNYTIPATGSEEIITSQQLTQGIRKSRLVSSELINPGNKLTSEMIPSSSKFLPSEKSENLLDIAPTHKPNTSQTNRKREISKKGTKLTEKKPVEKVDSKELLYCMCKEVAYGRMVACDNKMCEIEWYHCECLGMKNPPRGKWFCPLCIDLLSLEKQRKST